MDRTRAESPKFIFPLLYIQLTKMFFQRLQNTSQNYIEEVSGDINTAAGT